MARKNKKREAGSGSITKRKDGRWQGQYVSGYDPETGKPRRHTIYGKTQKEVADMLGISQSYISRLEKKIIKRLKREMIKMGCV